MSKINTSPSTRTRVRSTRASARADQTAENQLCALREHATIGSAFGLGSRLA